MKWLKKALLLLFLVTFSALLFKPLCDLLFHCGCQGVWAAGSAFCNIHTPGVAHCPWCSTGSVGVYLPKGLVWMTQIAVVLIPSNLSNKARVIVGLLAFVVVGAAAGLIFGIFTHYPTFLSVRF